MPKYGSVSQVILQLVVAMARMDGHGLELEKAGPVFFQLKCYACKNHQKMIMVLLPDEVCLISSS